MEKRIVITGIGVLSSNGIGRSEYWQALRESKVGFKDISWFSFSVARLNTIVQPK